MLVIIITTLTIVSSAVIARINISNLVANYHVSTSENTLVNLDACFEDALLRLASSTVVSGSFSISTEDVDCVYNVSAIINGFKYATSTATTTSDAGVWVREATISVNVSTSPITVSTYKDMNY